MWLYREKIEKSKLPAFVCRVVWWFLGGKYKCVFSVVCGCNCGFGVDNVSIFYYFCDWIDCI